MSLKKLIVTIAISYIVSSISLASPDKRPNVLIILSDDQGWADTGFNGSKDILTPNLDNLAKDGVSFSQGYATHPYCSPSRAGLLAGRYQYRFGHENNVPFKDADADWGLPLSEELISETFNKAGYATAAIGKWHLGNHDKFLPSRRGFQDWYGFSGGGMDYWGSTRSKPKEHGMRRDEKLLSLSELTYLTDDFSKAAVEYIDKYNKQKKPFLMFLAYNAPHGPMHAPKKYLDKVAHIQNGPRAIYASMVMGMDHGIGQVVDKLKQTGVYDNTIIIFYSDNGASPKQGGSNVPFRGNKGMLFEGGVRVPFLISWPKTLPKNKRFEKAITALDIFPTVVAAAGIKGPKKTLDGKNLLPYLGDNKQVAPHQGEPLFWRYTNGKGYSVLLDDYKLIYSHYKKKSFLFNLKDDPSEITNLADRLPNKVKELEKAYERWSNTTVKGIWPDGHIQNVEKEEKTRQSFIDSAMKGEAKAYKN